MAVWKEKSTPKGVLKYRMPNIAEGYFFLALVDKLKTHGDLIRVKGQFLQEMAYLLDYSALGYADFSELLFDKENMRSPLSEIVDELFNDITGSFAKKT